MKKLFIIFAMAAVGSAAFTSCKKDDNNTVVPGGKIDYTSLTPATNYISKFVDEAGATTVDFSGQTARQEMLSKLDSVLKVPAKSNAAVDAVLLKNMFANTGNPFPQAELNSSGKDIRSKTATSLATAQKEAEWARIEGWLTKIADISTGLPRTAADGTSGVTDGASKYLVSANGIEYGQLVQKGLIGACFMDQISNIYLGDAKQNESGNNEKESGKNYKKIEHYWDEAYGYLTKNGVYPDPVKANERFLGSYVRQAKDSVNIFMAFLKGRAGATNNDKTMMDQQRALIQNMLQDAVATLAISYLNKTVSQYASNPGSAMHSMSEGLGFLYSLRFARNAKINAAKSDELMAKLMDGKGFYGLTTADIQSVRDQIATATGIDKNTVVNH